MACRRTAALLSGLFLLGASILAACESRLVLGSTCVRRGECEGGLTCIFGRCREECITSDDCAIGEHCLLQPGTDARACSLGERCDSAECPDGLVCGASNECVNACGTIVECPDRVCVENACVPQRDDADAGASDAPTRDAGADCHGPACRPIVALSAGWRTFHAIDEAGQLWSWGVADSGELGDYTATHDDCDGCSSRPVAALDGPGGARLDDVVSAVGGEGRTCIRREDGGAWCWTSSADPAPQRIEWTDGSTFGALENVAELAAGRGHACARQSSGELWCWGEGTNGALGTGNEDHAAPRARRATLVPDVERVWATFDHTFVLDEAGLLHGFGGNARRMLGSASPGPFVTSTTMPAVPAVPSHLGLAEGFACALGADGEIRCWGGDTLLGSGATFDAGCECTETPQTHLHPAGVTWAGLAAGPASATSAYAWTTTGALYSWGDRFGLPFAADPTLRTDVTNVASVAATMDSTTVCALTRDGDVICWGRTDNGELGRGTSGTSSVLQPAPVEWPE